jgi:hypothetical protein
MIAGYNTAGKIPAFKELYRKIKRHKSHILNTIRLGMSNARIEATNNKIKLIIRKAYGFRNIQNYANPMVIRTSMIEDGTETAFLTLKVRITLPVNVQGSCSFRLHYQAI